MATVLGFDVPRRVSAPKLEAEALRTRAGLLHAPWERVLEVEGPDAGDFLHVLLTQHVRGIEPGSSARAALANRKGHLEADLTLRRVRADLFFIRVPSIAAARLVSVLESHRIMEDVRFRWTHEHPDAFLLLGPEAARMADALALGAPALPGPHRPDVSVVPVDEVGPEDRVLCFDVASREAVLARCAELGATPIGWDAFDRIRIERGRAWFGIDADEERLVPEPGFGDRIHYDKGCYLGQEPLARLHFRGKPNWELVRFRTAGRETLGQGSQLLDGEGSVVGWVTSSTPTEDGRVALGYLHRRFRELRVPRVRTAEGRSLTWEGLVDSEA